MAARLLAALIRVPPDASASRDADEDASARAAAVSEAAVSDASFALEAAALRRRCGVASKDLRATAELFLVGLLDASHLTEAMAIEDQATETAPGAWAHGAHLPRAYAWVPVEAGRSLGIANSSTTSSSSSTSGRRSGLGVVAETVSDAELRRLEALHASAVRRNNLRTARVHRRATRGLLSPSWGALAEADGDARSDGLAADASGPAGRSAGLLAGQAEAAAAARDAAVLERYGKLAKRQQAQKKKEEDRAKATWPPMFFQLKLNQNEAAPPRF
jgi:hypothetical protein